MSTSQKVVSELMRSRFSTSQKSGFRLLRSRVAPSEKVVFFASTWILCIFRLLRSRLGCLDFCKILFDNWKNDVKNRRDF